MLEKNDFAILKGENERLLNELDRVKNLMREELSKLQGSIRLEMNLERGRTRDDTQTQEARIKETDNKIETEISNMRTHLETLKFDIVKYIVGMPVLSPRFYLLETPYSSCRRFNRVGGRALPHILAHLQGWREHRWGRCTSGKWIIVVPSACA